MTKPIFHQSKILIGSPEQIEKQIEQMALLLIGTENYTNHPDFLLVEEQEKASIGIAKTKDLINFTKVKPYQSENKLIVISPSDKLTHQAQNSLLKVLEEPPQKTQIILATNNSSNLLDTILSRCVLIKLETNEEDTSEKNISNFIKLDLIDKFLFIDKLSKIKSPIEKRAKTESFLKRLMDHYRNESKNEITTKKTTLINDTYIKIKSNANFKLVMDNLIVNLE